MPPSSSEPPAPALLQALLDASSEGLALADAAGRVVWANAPLARSLGLPPDALPGRPLLAPIAAPSAARVPPGQHALIDPLEAEAAAAALLAEALERGEGYAGVELRHRLGDGREVVSRLGAARADDGRHWLLSLRDVTETAALREDAAHRAEVLERAQQAGRVGVWQRHLVTGEARWDRHMHAFFDWPEEQGPPDTATALGLIHPDDRGLAEPLAPGGRPGFYEARYRIVRRDGSVRHVHSSWQVKPDQHGRPARALGVMVDDTEAWSLAQSYLEATSQLRLATALAGIATWRHDLATDRMHYNDTAFEMLGLARREGGVPIDEVRSFVHPQDLHLVLESAAQALRTDQPVDVRVRYIRTDGSVRDTLTRRVVQRGEDGRPIAFVGVTLDLTEQLAATRESLELSRSLDLAVSAARLGIWTREVDGSGGTWNAQQYALCGLPPADQPPTAERFIDEIVHPEDRDRVARGWLRALREEHSTTELEHRIVQPDGRVCWLSTRFRRETGFGRTLIVGISLDVTERYESLAALRDATERAAFATRGAGIGTWEQFASDPVSVWDDQMYRLRGLDPRAGPLSAEQRRALVHPDDLAAIERQRIAAWADDASAAYEFRVRWPDGSWHWLAARTTPVYDEHRGVRRRIGVNWDITAAKNAAAALQQKELAQRESASKSQFLSRMSHELRTPLNAVLGFTQLLQAEDDGLSASRIEKLAHIRAGGEHLLSLINDVLDLSSVEAGQMRLEFTALAAGDALDEAVALVRPLAEARGVTIELEAVSGRLLADRTRLRQVLINLLTNAVKYNRAGGRVQLRAGAEDGWLRLQVADTGRGMTADQVAHLFEPFNRLGAEREGIEGTGIGLVIVKALVESMGGHIEADSRPGVGTTMTLRLRTPDTPPGTVRLDEPAGGPAPSLADRAAAPAGQRGSLLYIEDNMVNTRLVQALVAQRPGIRLDCAEDGAGGIAQAAAEPPDLVLIDMQLPDMHGLEVLRRLRAAPATRGIPCIALSANAMPEDIEQALAAGFADYWTKPIDVSAFMASLDALFLRRAGTGD